MSTETNAARNKAAFLTLLGTDRRYYQALRTVFFRGRGIAPVDLHNISRSTLFALALLPMLVQPFSAHAQDPNQLIQTTCIACHNQYTLQAGLNLQPFDAEQPHLDPVVAEKLIRKLRAGQMPPPMSMQDSIRISGIPSTRFRSLVISLQDYITKARHRSGEQRMRWTSRQCAC